MAKLKTLRSSLGREAYSEGLKIWEQAKNAPSQDNEVALMDQAYKCFRTSAVRHKYFAACRSMVLINFDIIPVLTDRFLKECPIEDYLLQMVEYLKKTFTGVSPHHMLPEYLSTYFKRLNSAELNSLACILLSLDLSTDFHEFCSVKSSCLLQNDQISRIRQNFKICYWLLERTICLGDPYAVLLTTAFNFYHELADREKIKNILHSNVNHRRHPETLRAASLLCHRDYIALDGVAGSATECARNKELALEYMMEYLRVLRFDDFPVLEPFATHLALFPKIGVPFKGVNDINGGLYRGFAEFMLSSDCESTNLGIMRYPFLIKPVFCFANSKFKFDRTYYATFWMTEALVHGDKLAIEYAEDVLRKKIVLSASKARHNRHV